MATELRLVLAKYKILFVSVATPNSAFVVNEPSPNVYTRPRPETGRLSTSTAKSVTLEVALPHAPLQTISARFVSKATGTSMRFVTTIWSTLVYSPFCPLLTVMASCPYQLVLGRYVKCVPHQV